MSSLVSQFPLTTAAALATIAQYQIFASYVGLGRPHEYPPARIDFVNEEFEAAYRVQLNSLSSITIYLTCLFLFAQLSGKDKVAAGLGSIYLLGRLWLAYSCIKNPRDAKVRAPGFLIGFLAQTALLGGSLFLAAQQVFRK